MIEIPDGAGGGLAFALVGTIRHDGRGGVADDFTEDGSVLGWLDEQFAGSASSWTAGVVQPDRVRRLRAAARAAFAATCAPHPPSRADRSGRMTALQASSILTEASAALRIRSEVVLHDGGVSVRRTTTAQDQKLIEGLIAAAVIDFLTGPSAGRLRSCQAPRCVRYFVQEHGKQQWCKPSCGNRARVARHAALARSRS